MSKVGKEPTLFDVYKRLHRSKRNPDEFITEEAQKLAEEYENRVAEVQLQHDVEGSSVQSENRIYLEVVGGHNKKGRVFGIGSQAAIVAPDPSSTSSVSTDGASSTEVASLKSQVQALTEELQQKDIKLDQLQSRMDLWDDRFKSLLIADQFRLQAVANICEEDSAVDNDQT